jgi:hypothetical protein
MGLGHIPFILIATDEKARMSRLEIIFAVVAWYFLKPSVAKKASTWLTCSCVTSWLQHLPAPRFPDYADDIFQ